MLILLIVSVAVVGRAEVVITAMAGGDTGAARASGLRNDSALSSWLRICWVSCRSHAHREFPAPTRTNGRIESLWLGPGRRNSSSTALRTIAILVGVVAVLYLAREILIPLAFSIILTLILSPAVSWLTKARLGRGVASVVVMVIAVSAMAGISVVLFNQLVQVINELPVYQG